MNTKTQKEIDNLKKRISDLENSNNDNYVHIVLDRSGSMSVIWDSVISGFNEFIKGQKNFPSTLVSLTAFDHEIESVFEKLPVRKVRSLRQYKTVYPRGVTSLYDAIGYAIRRAERAGAGGKTVFVIYTDGQENNSKEFSRQQIFDMISMHRKQDWKFVFLGANQDAYAVGTGLGMYGGSTFSFTTTAAGTSSSWGLATNSVRSYLSGDTSEVELSKDVVSSTP